MMPNYDKNEVCAHCGKIFDEHHPDTDRCPVPPRDTYFKPFTGEESFNISDADFVKYIAKLLKKNSGQEIATKLGVSTPTIIRWVQGRNLPHQVLRGSILKTYPIDELN